MELSELEGIGPVRAEALRAVGIVSLRDLLFTLPVRYEDRQTIYPCAFRNPGAVMVRGTITDPLKTSWFHGLCRITGTISDSTGRMPISWYNAPWIPKSIPVGREILLYGRMYIKNGRRQLLNPVVVEHPGLYPVYRAIPSIPAKTFRKLICIALAQVDECCPETLPAEYRIEHHLCELNYAIREVHFPTDSDNLKLARRRLSFETILIYLIYITMNGSRRNPAPSIKYSADDAESYWHILSFLPTNAQRRVLNEIGLDMQKTSAMARMVQGDVGCGKTAVAFGAIYIACRAGFQACMMAPTEILAIQHYENALKMLSPAGIQCHLLTGSTGVKKRREILNELCSDRPLVIFGTHALISQDVKYGRLGLVITDEQHRFGVRQRSTLQDKGMADDGTAPHVLVMSATPIPRSLALILYGDLDLSVIDELPAGRIPVRTRLVPDKKRSDMYRFLRKEVEKGRQAYVVCPLVEDDDDEQVENLHSAKAVFKQLKDNELKGLKLAITWGGQKSEEKNKILNGFSEGIYQVLISTTVIEVGVNNPNATIMIIENADRFGLSQLHQLRGRVGRGTEESWCFLLSDSSDKLQILCSTNDGFLIAKKDMELRGPGDLTGTRQSGEGSGIMMEADVMLLDEVSRSVRNLHRNPESADILAKLETYAAAYFEKGNHEIALS